MNARGAGGPPKSGWEKQPGKGLSRNGWSQNGYGQDGLSQNGSGSIAEDGDDGDDGD